MEDEINNYDSPEMVTPEEDASALFEDNSEELSSVDGGEPTDFSETEYYQNFPEFETPSTPITEDDFPTEPSCPEDPSTPSVFEGVTNDISDENLNDVISSSPSNGHYEPPFKGFDCTVGCAGNCAGKCDGCCHNSCYNSCKSSYSS